jgi:hypothetical protein
VRLTREKVKLWRGESHPYINRGRGGEKKINPESMRDRWSSQKEEEKRKEN